MKDLWNIRSNSVNAKCCKLEPCKGSAREKPSEWFEGLVAESSQSMKQTICLSLQG